jgi:hypothetical protein
MTSLKNVSVPLLGVGAAALVALMSLTRKRARARRSATARTPAADFMLLDVESEPSQLDTEDLQWRPPVGVPLAGPEDLEPLELDFDELEETDLATAAITIDLIGPERERTEVPIEGGEPGAERGDGGEPRSAANQVDDLDWRDELENEQPPHRYR